MYNYFYRIDKIGKHPEILDLSNENYDNFHFPENGYIIDKIILPDSLNRIDDISFRKSRIKEIIAKNITELGMGCFNRSLLETFNIENTDIQKIPMDCFTASNIKNIVLPKNLLEIKSFAFSECYKLEEIYIPNSVKYISKNVFEGCFYLKNIHLPEILEEIEECTFKDCESLTFIKIPDTVLSIGKNAFYNCRDLSKIILPKSLEKFNTNAFDTRFLETLVYTGNNNNIKQAINNFCKENKIKFVTTDLDYIINNISNYSFKDINEAFKENQKEKNSER